MSNNQARSSSSVSSTTGDRPDDTTTAKKMNDTSSSSFPNTSAKFEQQQQQPKKKKEKNVFIYMESTIQTKSPKSLLYTSIEENRRIKVWTRSHSYVRSICTGYLVAFDRWWNLAMIDVDEVYKIPQKASKKDTTVAAKASSTNEDDKNMPMELLHLKSKRYTLFHRHVNQLFIRGDNVVMVTYADKTQ